jgi:hypothetical protein
MVCRIRTGVAKAFLTGCLACQERKSEMTPEDEAKIAKFFLDQEMRFYGKTLVQVNGPGTVPIGTLIEDIEYRLDGMWTQNDFVDRMLSENDALARKAEQLQKMIKAHDIRTEVGATEERIIALGQDLAWAKTQHLESLRLIDRLKVALAKVK